MNDTIHRIAERILGDVAKWSDIATFNELDPPYIVNYKDVQGSQKATGLATFYVDTPPAPGHPIIIPKETVVATELKPFFGSTRESFQYMFSTTEEKAIMPGTVSVEVPVEAVAQGIDYNIFPNRLTTIITWGLPITIPIDRITTTYIELNESAGNQTSYFTAGVRFDVRGTTMNDKSYMVRTTGTTSIFVNVGGHFKTRVYVEQALTSETPTSAIISQPYPSGMKVRNDNAFTTATLVKVVSPGDVIFIPMGSVEITRTSKSKTRNIMSPKELANRALGSDFNLISDVYGVQNLGQVANDLRVRPSGGMSIVPDPTYTDKFVPLQPQDISFHQGMDNLAQAITHRLVTERGELMAHPEYGSLIPAMIGAVGVADNVKIIALEVKNTLLSDPRILAVLSINVVSEGGGAYFATAEVLVLGQDDAQTLNLVMPKRSVA